MSLIDPLLMEILRCPVCHESLSENEEDSTLVCRGGHVYPVIDGVPDMVPPDEEAS